MAAVRLENVTKVFDGNVTAVSGFSLDIGDGEFVVIVGPSGCGKTTTLRIIAGLEQPDTGSVYIAGSLVNRLAPRDRDVAMVFQNYALYPHMTVYQNMAFALKLRKLPKVQIKDRLQKAAGLLAITHLLDRRPDSLSGGQRQRVALGRAIVRNPNAFLFDEPLSNLDAAERLRMRTELKILHRKIKATTIYVTHDQSEAMTLGDRVCVMREGAIQQTGSSAEIYERPANRFVAGFVGTPTMNFLAGRVKIVDDTTCFITENNVITLPLRLKTLLAGYNDQPLVLGVRPESISPEGFRGQVGNTISAAVDIVEPVGSRTNVYFTADGGEKFVADLDPHTELRPDQRIELHLDLDRLHIFEPGPTGRNLTLPAGG